MYGEVSAFKFRRFGKVDLKILNGFLMGEQIDEEACKGFKKTLDFDQYVCFYFS